MMVSESTGYFDAVARRRRGQQQRSVNETRPSPERRRLTHRGHRDTTRRLTPDEDNNAGQPARAASHRR